MIHVAEREQTVGEVYLCGADDAIRLVDMIDRIAKRLGTKPRVLRLPVTPFFWAGDLCEAICKPLGIEPPIYRRRVAFYTKDRSFSIAKMRGTGFTNQYSNESGIDDLTDWYVKGRVVVMAQRKADMLVVAPHPFFTPRGTPFSVYYRTMVLAEAGVKIDLLTYGVGQDADIPGCRIVRVPRVKMLEPVPIGPSGKKAVLDVFMLIWTIGMMIRNRYAIVHAHEEAVFWVRFLKPFFRYRMIYDMHSSLPQQLGNFGFFEIKTSRRSFQMAGGQRAEGVGCGHHDLPRSAGLRAGAGRARRPPFPDREFHL